MIIRIALFTVVWLLNNFLSPRFQTKKEKKGRQQGISQKSRERVFLLSISCLLLWTQNTQADQQTDLTAPPTFGVFYLALKMYWLMIWQISKKRAKGFGTRMVTHSVTSLILSHLRGLPCQKHQTMIMWEQYWLDGSKKTKSAKIWFPRRFPSLWTHLI